MSPVFARHSGDSRFHAIKHIERDGSVQTYCSGRWPATDPVEIATPPATECCQRCLLRSDLAARHARVIAEGLKEVEARFDFTDEQATEPGVEA